MTHSPRRGFTLVEMLVVLVLLSLIMLAVVSALRSVAQGSDRADARFERLDDERITRDFLRGVLARVSARRVTSPGRSGPLFEGASDHVAWVGVMPARYGAGGRTFFRLSIEQQEEGSALVLRYLPWADQPQFPDWQQAAAQDALTRVATELYVFCSHVDAPSKILVELEVEEVEATSGPKPAPQVLSR